MPTLSDQPNTVLHTSLPPPLIPSVPFTALAPMQDVTTLPFMRIIARHGAPDYFFTEFFRVYETSHLEPHILSSITENTTGRPVFAQLIGEDIFHLTRIARLLRQYPIAGIDLNLGCPAPKIYRKNVGGGLLRDPQRVDEILDSLRHACTPGLFTVKMRIGFENAEHFPRLIEIVNRHKIDLLSVHGRTVKEMYRGEPHYDWIHYAVQHANCPVFANGNISSVNKGRQVLEQTGAFGLMIGRSAIRNPWIFRQIREHYTGQPIFQPTLSDVRAYIEELWLETRRDGRPDKHQIAYLKKFLSFIGQSVDPDGRFLHEVRRTSLADEFFATCDRHLIEDGRAQLPFASEPYPGVIARPNQEGDSCSG